MEENTRMPLLGDDFPEMEVQTTHGKLKLPEYFKGKWFVLFSHPADFTPVCTTEFIAFQNKYEELKEMNTELIGLSIDQVFSHMKWVDWIKENKNVEIKFPIIADHGNVAKKLGLLHPGKGSNTVRAVYIVDGNGKIRLILYYPQEIGRNMDEIVRAVKALQYSDENKVALPADWPKNEFLENAVIIPPPTSEEEKQKRLEMKEKGEIECLDWWFCYKKE